MVTDQKHERSGDSKDDGLNEELSSVSITSRLVMDLGTTTYRLSRSTDERGNKLSQRISDGVG